MKLSRRQAAIIGAHTGVTFGPFADICRYAAHKMADYVGGYQPQDQDDYPGPFFMMTHANELSERAEPDFAGLLVEFGDFVLPALDDTAAILAIAADESEPVPDFSDLRYVADE